MFKSIRRAKHTANSYNRCRKINYTYFAKKIICNSVYTFPNNYNN